MGSAAAEVSSGSSRHMACHNFWEARDFLSGTKRHIGAAAYATIHIVKMKAAKWCLSDIFLGGGCKTHIWGHRPRGDVPGLESVGRRVGVSSLSSVRPN